MQAAYLRGNDKASLTLALSFVTSGIATSIAIFR